MTANKKRLLLPRTLARAGWDIVAARDDVEATPYAPTIAAADLHALLPEVDGIGLALTRFGAPELAAAPRLKVVARVGVGFDTVDVPALTAQKIPLMTVGLANAPSVAEHAFALMLALAKRNAHHDGAVRAGTWRDQLGIFPVDLLDKTLLVIGFGRIGTRMARRALAFEMRVLVYDPYIPADTIAAAGCVPVADLDAGMAAADMVSVHCPKSAETIDLIDAARLARMKPTAYLINTARGGIVNEPALALALATKKLAGAGIDVFEREPAALDHPLLALPNVIVSPHMAGLSVEALDRMAATTVRNILGVLDGAPAKENAVNPEVFG
jgi:D-3-phosphoglycerate dehydrogenase / 2-oxoglutarate reductase